MNNQGHRKSTSNHDSSHHHHHHSSHQHSSTRRHTSTASHLSKPRHSTSRQRSLIAFLLLLLTLIIEFFPSGLITRLMNGRTVPGLQFDQIFTFFKATRYGHTNLGNILLAAACFILFVLTAVRLVHSSVFVKRIYPISAGIAFLIALLPLFFGASSLSLANMAIAAILALVLWLSAKNPFEKR